MFSDGILNNHLDSRSPTVSTVVSYSENNWLALPVDLRNSIQQSLQLIPVRTKCVYLLPCVTLVQLLKFGKCGLMRLQQLAGDALRVNSLINFLKLFTH